MSSEAALRYDVFLSYNSLDRPAIVEIANWLKAEGAKPWLDVWELGGGVTWQEALEKGLRYSDACAVFFGPSGLSAWQNEEMRAAIDQRVHARDNRFRVIPVFLPGAPAGQRDDLPAFLSRSNWVIFKALDDKSAFSGLLKALGLGKDSIQTDNPYPGLRPFEMDSQFYFGRDALLKQGLERLTRIAAADAPLRFLAVLGCSGSGKSSFARAGLLSAVRNGALDGSNQWPVLVCRPESSPVDALVAALSKLDHTEKSASAFLSLKREMEAGEQALHAQALVELRDAPRDRRIVLLIDQFEECFTLCQKPEWREVFIRNVIYAASAANGKLLVLIAMRADFYGECLSYPALANALASQIPVPPMQDDELRLAIEQPALANGCEFEPGLVDRLIEDVRGDAGSLPLLQFALQELWNQRRGRYLAYAAYRAMGSVVQALGQRADHLFETLSEDDRKLCRRTFLRLVQNVEGSKYTRRIAPIGELVSGHAKPETIRQLINRFTGEDVRLLTTEGEPPPRGKGVFVELAHEALIRGWGTLSHWLDQDQEFQLWLKRFRFALELWKEKEKDSGTLLRGALLQEAAGRVSAREDDINAEELEFYRASAAAHEREEANAAEARIRDRWNRRVRRSLIVGTSLLSLAAAAGFFFSYRENRVANSQALAADALKIPDKESDLAVWLALYAFAADLSRAGTEALYKAIQVKEGPAFPAECGSPENCGAVNSLSFDGSHTIATGGDDKAVRLWNVPDYRSLASFPLTSGVVSVALSADGQRLAAADYAAIHVWDVASHKPLLEEPLVAVALFFLPDGRLLTITEGGLTQTRDVGTQSAPVAVLHATGPVHRAAVDRAGRWIALTGSGKAALWRLDGSRKAAVLGRIDDNVQAAAFSPDASQIALALDNGRVTIWNVSGNKPLLEFQAHGKGIADIAWSPDNRIVTGSGDTTARIWSTKGEELYTLMGSDYAVTSVALNRDGSRLAVGSRDNAVRLYPMTRTVLLAEALSLVPCLKPLTPGDCLRYLRRSSCPALPWKLPSTSTTQCPQ